MSNTVILNIACSLDSYIASADGRVDFLYEAISDDIDLGFDTFLAGIETVIMGSKTYFQIINELSPDVWPYQNKLCYVYSHSSHENTENVNFTSLSPEQLLARIESERCGNVWIVGGGEIVKMFLAQNLIDKYFLYIMPILLGDGLPLFPKGFPSVTLHLESSRQLQSVTELIYRKQSTMKH